MGRYVWGIMKNPTELAPLPCPPVYSLTCIQFESAIQHVPASPAMAIKVRFNFVARKQSGQSCAGQIPQMQSPSVEQCVESFQYLNAMSVKCHIQ